MHSHIPSPVFENGPPCHLRCGAQQIPGAVGSPPPRAEVFIAIDQESSHVLSHLYADGHAARKCMITFPHWRPSVDLLAVLHHTCFDIRGARSVRRTSLIKWHDRLQSSLFTCVHMRMLQNSAQSHYQSGTRELTPMLESMCEVVNGHHPNVAPKC